MPNENARSMRPKSVGDHKRRPRLDKGSKAISHDGPARQATRTKPLTTAHAAEARLHAVIKRANRTSG